MTLSVFQLLLFSLAAVALGGTIAWIIRGREIDRRLSSTDDAWQTRYDKIARHKEHVVAENTTLQTYLESERGLLIKHKHAAALSRTELESTREKANTLSKELFVAAEERNELGEKLTRSESALIAAQQQVVTQETEFTRGRDFYKSQADGALEQRATLERQIDDAKKEHESLRNLLISSKEEHESVTNLLNTAQSRLQNLDDLESRYIAIQAENAELRQEATQAKTDAETLRRELAEVVALKDQNKDLTSCLQSMESSRKQHEDDARRYRNQYEKSEQQSETLRFKLGDIEKNWAELQRQEEESRVVEANNNSSTPSFGLDTPDGEIDDLTEIIGVGKVFAATLNRLGVFHFRQIAAFGAAELARVNSELKEFKGRIEHDDWIGQSKELHFRKYGDSERP